MGKNLVALDHTPGSEYALAWTLKNLIKPGDKLFVLHVRAPGVTDQAIANLKEKLFAFVKVIGIPENQVEFVLKDSGDAKGVILSEAKSLSVDNIILSSRGLDIVTSLLVGSVSKYVAAHALVPVIIVKPPPAVFSTPSGPSTLLQVGNFQALGDLVTFKP